MPHAKSIHAEDHFIQTEVEVQGLETHQAHLAPRGGEVKSVGYQLPKTSCQDPGTRWTTTTSRQSFGTVGRASGPIAKGIRSGINDTSNALAPSFVCNLYVSPKIQYLAMKPGKKTFAKPRQKVVCQDPGYSIRRSLFDPGSGDEAACVGADIVNDARARLAL
ncbi:hypothetical protein C8J57DRAFT_1221039 [Mycena rebaudengoi]|nr:hypothetical protein C8J57DRAFT_1221039 [Mycena rebaudengoi]